MCLFVVINRTNQHAIIFQEIFCQIETMAYKREPLAVSVFVVLIYIVIVVFPVFCAGVVRRINVDKINILFVRIVKNRKREVVITLDHQIMWISFAQIKTIFDDLFQNRYLSF